MIDYTTEEVVSLGTAAHRLPRCRGGRPVNPSTLWRWATRGLRGVRLETIRVGGSTCTSTEAVKRFLAALNGDSVTTKLPNAAKTQEEVERRLEDHGI